MIRRFCCFLLKIARAVWCHIFFSCQLQWRWLFVSVCGLVYVEEGRQFSSVCSAVTQRAVELVCLRGRRAGWCLGIGRWLNWGKRFQHFFTFHVTGCKYKTRCISIANVIKATAEEISQLCVHTVFPPLPMTRPAAAAGTLMCVSSFTSSLAVKKFSSFSFLNIRPWACNHEQNEREKCHEVVVSLEQQS